MVSVHERRQIYGYVDTSRIFCLNYNLKILNCFHYTLVFTSDALSTKSTFYT